MEPRGQTCRCPAWARCCDRALDEVRSIVMSGQGSVYRRCGCVDPVSRRQPWQLVHPIGAAHGSRRQPQAHPAGRVPIGGHRRGGAGESSGAGAGRPQRGHLDGVGLAGAPAGLPLIPSRVHAAQLHRARAALPRPVSRAGAAGGPSSRVRAPDRQFQACRLVPIAGHGLGNSVGNRSTCLQGP